MDTEPTCFNIRAERKYNGQYQSSRARHEGCANLLQQYQRPLTPVEKIQATDNIVSTSIDAVSHHPVINA